MKATCAGCQCAVRDRAALCQRCTRALVAYLQSVPGLVADLIIMRSGEQRVAPLMPRVHLTSTPKIPAQITPQRGAPVLRGDRELADLGTAVMSTAARLAAARGVGGAPPGPRVTPRGRKKPAPPPPKPPPAGPPPLPPRPRARPPPRRGAGPPPAAAAHRAAAPGAARRCRAGGTDRLRRTSRAGLPLAAAR